MAKTHFVKSFRGQRKCQYVMDESNWTKTRCGLNREAHRDLDHEFTQTPLRCGHCGEDINIGDPYKWVAPRAHRASRGTRKVRHQTCPGWKPSELTSSPHLATLYAAQEAAEEAASALQAPTTPEDAEAFLEDLRGILEACAADAMEAAESYRESAEAIEEGFQHPTYQSEELMEKSSEIEYWCDELSNTDLEEYEEEETDCASCGFGEDDDVHQIVEDDDYHAFEPDEDQSLEDWAEEQRDRVIEAVGETPV